MAPHSVTSAVVSSETPNKSILQSEDQQYWSEHCLPSFTSLLKNSGAYTIEQQDGHIQFFKDHVIPGIGPRRDSEKPIYLLTHNGSTFEASINLSYTGKPTVRFTFEPEHTVGKIPEAVGADMRWYDQLANAFFLNEEEAVNARAAIPPVVARIPKCFIAFDLVEDKRILKVYFSPLLKKVATGISFDDEVVKAITSLEPCGQDLKPAMDVIQEYRAESSEPLEMQMVAIDCIDPTKGARVKIYTRISSNKFEDVRYHVTLGGRRTDTLTLEGLEILKSIWHLLLNEKEAIDEKTNKAELDPENHHANIMISWEVQAGKSMPEVKLYVPMFEYSQSNKEICANYSKIFESWGWSWGVEGTYSKVFGESFAAAGEKLVHTYASFNFSKKGKYMTSYMAPPPLS